MSTQNNQPNHIIDIKNLSLTIHGKKIFSNVNFNVNQKDLINILGPNGSGKTTLIKTIMGFQKIDQGSIKHFGEKLYGYVPQYFTTTPYIKITAFEFLKLSSITNLTIDEAIQITQIDNLLQKDLGKLSGGELRKILIAKALLHSKEVLFLDEPTCWLDKESQQKFYNLIKELNKNFTFAITLISHDPFLKRDFFSKIVKMEC
jgi:zinc transport system ATP-binding protein